MFEGVLSAWVTYAQRCSWRFVVYISLELLPDLHINNSESQTVASLLLFSQSPWPRAKMAKFPACYWKAPPEVWTAPLLSRHCHVFCQCCNLIKTTTCLIKCCESHCLQKPNTLSEHPWVTHQTNSWIHSMWQRQKNPMMEKLES